VTRAPAPPDAAGNGSPLGAERNSTLGFAAAARAGAGAGALANDPTKVQFSPLAGARLE